MNVQQLSCKIRGCLYEVHKVLGAGLLKSVYEGTLLYELKNQGLSAQAQMVLPVFYKDTKMDQGFRMDVEEENQVVIEIKSVELLHDLHKKQLLTYFKLSEMRAGYLVNFNAVHLTDKESLFRIINNY